MDAALSEVERLTTETRKLIREASKLHGAERRRMLDRALALATYLEEFALHHGIIARRELSPMPKHTSTSRIGGARAVNIYGGRA